MLSTLRTNAARFSGALLLGLSLTVATPVAFASPGEGGHGAAAEHADDAHGADAHGGDAHAEGGDHGEGHHGPAFTGDNDGDGTANWLDSDDEHYVLTGIGFHLINFLLYGGLLWFFARQPIADMLRNRALTIKQDLGEAARLKEAADARYAEVQARLNAFEGEMAAMVAKAETDAEAERQAIVERGKAEADRLLVSARQQIRDEAARAKAAIRKDAVDMAVKLAESTLKQTMSANDQRTLATEFLTTVQEDRRV